MSQTTHIPGTVVKTSALPEELPTHLIGVSDVTNKTVKYSVEDLQQTIETSTLAKVPEPLPSAGSNLYLFYNY
jgi:hypothetical protein